MAPQFEVAVEEEESGVSDASGILLMTLAQILGEHFGFASL